jgi:hypothetical protein
MQIVKLIAKRQQASNDELKLKEFFCTKTTMVLMH